MRNQLGTRQFVSRFICFRKENTTIEADQPIRLHEHFGPAPMLGWVTDHKQELSFFWGDCDFACYGAVALAARARRAGSHVTSVGGVGITRHFLANRSLELRRTIPIDGLVYILDSDFPREESALSAQGGNPGI